MSNHKFKVGDEGKTRNGHPYAAVPPGERDNCWLPEYPIVARVGDRHFHYTADGRFYANGAKDGEDLLPPTVAAPVDKLQRLLEEVRKARAAEHEARKAVAAAKAGVKPAEEAYVEAQRTRQQAMERLLSAMDEAVV